jgi:hypothetical protein
MMTGDNEPVFSALLMRLSLSIGDGVAPSTWKPTTLRGASFRMGASMPCDVLDGMACSCDSGDSGDSGALDD